ncbi:DNA polymerase III subunit gamma/tau [Enterobacteriaceae bacterium LUAb1]
MSYQVLARKWRPQAFTDVVGQAHVLTALANGLSLGRIHHAYLFSGTRGVGKTTIARLLAKGLNCETGITATPCGQCDNCHEIEQGRFVDLLEIDAASRTKVEDTRELLDNVQYAPARGRFKVYLIDEVHMLSRHSFNALLKTLEEPPPHVKFLLATTDPQKLPVTILSRCLQFHLKALDAEQIRGQLEHVLKAENICMELRAVQLLARAADGSMRDALSLADQAIAMGSGAVTTATVTMMLGTLDDEQPLALIEALAAAQGEHLMQLVEQVASCGIEWDALLTGMLSRLHRIAMLQLQPSAINAEEMATEQRLRELARTIPPDELQLYYQILLTGRKELPYAPDRRMGAEMTLLRALAFHPKAPSAPAVTSVSAPVASFPEPVIPSVASASGTAPAGQEKPNVSKTTSQLLQARTQLIRQQGAPNPKKSNPAVSDAQPVNSVLERLASVAERGVAKVHQKAEDNVANQKTEAYRWKARHPKTVTDTAVATTPKALRKAMEHEKTPELVQKLIAESQQRDRWAAEIATLTLPKLIQQLALNAWKEETSEGIYLHLRSQQRHLNGLSAQQVLQEAMSAAAGHPIALHIIEDDNLTVLTPLEWRQAIYEEKLAQARQSLLADSHIQTLCRFFDAELDEESIQPV